MNYIDTTMSTYMCHMFDCKAMHNMSECQAGEHTSLRLRSSAQQSQTVVCLFVCLLSSSLLRCMSSAPWLKPPEGVVEQHTSALARLCCETSAAVLRLRALWCLHSSHILFVLFGFIHIYISLLACCFCVCVCVCSPLISHCFRP